MEGRLDWTDQILRRIRAEFLEMPGMRLTLSQAKRLWGLDEQTCAQALELLITDRFLSRRPDGTYTRLTDGAPPYPPRRMVKANLTTAQTRAFAQPTGVSCPPERLEPGCF
jgi:hypothetical protein